MEADFHRVICTTIAFARYVKLQYGTVTASFSTRIKSIWMDTQRYHTLGHWNTMSSLSAAWKSPNLAAIPQVETSTAEMQAASAANWEFFLLRLGCQPHHRVCNRRSFWASLLEVRTMHTATLVFLWSCTERCPAPIIRRR